MENFSDREIKLVFDDEEFLLSNKETFITKYIISTEKFVQSKRDIIIAIESILSTFRIARNILLSLKGLAALAKEVDDLSYQEEVFQLIYDARTQISRDVSRLEQKLVKLGLTL